MTHMMAKPLADLSPDRPRLPPLTELWDLYRDTTDRGRRQAVRQGLWIAVVTYLLFSLVDIILIRDVAHHTIAIRFFVGGGVLAMLESQVRIGAQTKWMDGTCAAALLFGYVGWLIPALESGERTNLSYYMVYGTIFMMGANLFFSLRFRLSLFASGLILAIFFIALFRFAPMDLPYQVALGTFYISCFVFTSYVNWNLNTERFKVFINAHEAKILQRETDARGEQLLKLSLTDYLTGMENRRAVDQRLRDHWKQWQQNGSRFCVLLIDVDFFKRYNDRYGHQRGDQCLIEVAEALQRTALAYGASIGRFGGEEFIVMAPLGTGTEITAMAEDLRQTIAALAHRHEERRDGTAVLTVSIGASFTRGPATSKLEKLIHEADLALYSAKSNGRNCVKLFDPSDPEVSDEAENIASLLRIGIRRNLVSLVYQPILDLTTGARTSVEALMRLQMLDGTPISPSQFIPVAERTGIIIEIGTWVIRTACRDMLATNRADIVSVNVSPIQLKTPGFAASVAAILGETGVVGNRLAFEITEGQELEIHQDILRCIHDLRTLGIRIWLDDFGTGFAGLSWLRLIDFDMVKIDRSFLHASSEASGRVMLEDIVALIRNRGPDILIEGVENDEQMVIATGLGVRHLQGFHIGAPLPFDQLYAGTVSG